MGNNHSIDNMERAYPVDAALFGYPAYGGWGISRVRVFR
jgi:hypothetical protein